MKKILRVLILLFLVGLVLGCEDNNGSKKETKTDSVKFKEEYEEFNGSRSDSGKVVRVVSIPEENPIVYSDAEKISKMIDNKESFYVYFGFAKCPWCRSMIEQMLKVAEEKNVDTIYYVDVLDIRDVKKVNDNGEIESEKDGDEYYMKLLEQLGDVLSDYTLTDKDGNDINVGEKRIYAPNIIAIQDGKPIELTEGIADELEDPYSELTDKMIESSKNKLECIFKCLEDKVCKKNTC